MLSCFMNDETALGSAGTSDGRGYRGGSPREQSPLQARAAFLHHRSWDSIISLNRGACARGGAQHGLNSEVGAACEIRWSEHQEKILSLCETLDFLKSCHRAAPFLFFNGNTFADVGRRIGDAVFADLPTLRRRELISAIAHYIAGVLDYDAMVNTVDTLWQSAQLEVGTRVKTLRGSMHGVIVRVLEDGRVVWRPDGVESELTGLPESLLPG
jgi:hypothetical protein